MLFWNLLLKIKIKDSWPIPQICRNGFLAPARFGWTPNQCCLMLVSCWNTQVSVLGQQLMSFMLWWQIFRTRPDDTFLESVSLSTSPPNAPPRQSKRQGQRTKRPVAVYNLCLELEDGKMFSIFFCLTACGEYGVYPQGRPWFSILCVFISFSLKIIIFEINREGKAFVSGREWESQFCVCLCYAGFFLYF